MDPLGITKGCTTNRLTREVTTTVANATDSQKRAERGQRPRDFGESEGWSRSDGSEEAPASESVTRRC
ncbi:hypothetical protein GCM10022227_22030 [Streptomyces sedi]